MLTNETYLLLAAKHYNNSQCLNTEEFYEDLKRIQYLKRLFKKYKDSGQLKDRVILNQIIILYNVFGAFATDMLFFKLDELYYPYLKPFVILLGYLPEYVEFNGCKLNMASISMDTKIVEILRCI